MREREKTNSNSSFETDRTEVGVLCDVFGHSLILSRQRHNEQQGIPGLLAHCALSVDEGDEQGEDEEVCGSLILTGVEKQLQNRRVLRQNTAQLVEQQDQLSFHCWRGCARTGGQEHHEWPQDGFMMQQRLVGLSHQHLIHLQLLQLHVIGELPAEAPHKETLHHVLHHYKLQDGAHGAGLTALLLDKKEQHVLHIVLHCTRLISRDRAKTRASSRDNTEIEDTQRGQGGAGAQGVMLF